jgi:hypothetical protein
MTEDAEKADKLKSLMDQKRAIDEELGRLSHDPDHPALKPTTPFVEGEEVLVAVGDAKAPGKITGIDGGNYRVALASEVTVGPEDLSKR